LPEHGFPQLSLPLSATSTSFFPPHDDSTAFLCPLLVPGPIVYRLVGVPFAIFGNVFFYTLAVVPLRTGNSFSLCGFFSSHAFSQVALAPDRPSVPPVHLKTPHFHQRAFWAFPFFCFVQLFQFFFLRPKIFLPPFPLTGATDLAHVRYPPFLEEGLFLFRAFPPPMPIYVFTNCLFSFSFFLKFLYRIFLRHRLRS